MDIKITKIPVGALQANCYIVSSVDNPKVLIIDSGGDFLKIKEEISSLSKEAGGVILTHCHFDHMGACADFEKEGVPIYCAKEDSLLINSKDNLAYYFGTTVAPFKITQFLKEGDVEICGFKLHIYSTPGHTKGSISIRIGNDIFTGDTIFRYSYGRTDFPTGSIDDLSKSCEKLFKIEEDCTLYPGHNNVTTLENEKKYNPINEYIKR